MYTLYDVFPRIEKKEDILQEMGDVQNFLHDHGREHASPDELLFLAIIERHIKFFEKAKTMIGRNRFTVEYKGPEYNDNPSISEFQIIPIKQKSEDG